MTTRAGTVVRRQAILDAALQLFAARGVQATSIEEICATSGASVGSVYHHFGSKEGIAAALYVSAVDAYQRGAVEMFRKARSAEDGFRGCVEQYLRWVQKHRELAVLMLAVENSDIRRLAADEVAALNESFRAEVGEWLRSRAEAGDLPDIPRDLLIPAVLGPARRYAELWLEGSTSTSITEAARLLADVAWRGLVARPTATARPDGRD